MASSEQLDPEELDHNMPKSFSSQLIFPVGPHSVPSVKQDINLWARVGLGVLFEGDVFASEAADQKNWRLRLSAQEYKIV